jgi:hypothetical protein
LRQYAAVADYPKSAPEEQDNSKGCCQWKKGFWLLARGRLEQVTHRRQPFRRTAEIQAPQPFLYIRRPALAFPAKAGAKRLPLPIRQLRRTSQAQIGLTRLDCGLLGEWMLAAQQQIGYAGEREHIISSIRAFTLEHLTAGIG